MPSTLPALMTSGRVEPGRMRDQLVAVIAQFSRPAPWPETFAPTLTSADVAPTMAAILTLAGAPGERDQVDNPEDEKTAYAFRAWLDRRQAGRPTHPGVSAAETLAEARRTGEAWTQSSSTPLQATSWQQTRIEDANFAACFPPRRSGAAPAEWCTGQG